MSKIGQTPTAQILGFNGSPLSKRAANGLRDNGGTAVIDPTTQMPLTFQQAEKLKPRGANAGTNTTLPTGRNGEPLTFSKEEADFLKAQILNASNFHVVPFNRNQNNHAASVPTDESTGLPLTRQAADDLRGSSVSTQPSGNIPPPPLKADGTPMTKAEADAFHTSHTQGGTSTGQTTASGDASQPPLKADGTPMSKTEADALLASINGTAKA